MSRSTYSVFLLLVLSVGFEGRALARYVRNEGDPYSPFQDHDPSITAELDKNLALAFGADEGESPRDPSFSSNANQRAKAKDPKEKEEDIPSNLEEDNKGPHAIKHTEDYDDFAYSVDIKGFLPSNVRVTTEPIAHGRYVLKVEGKGTDAEEPEDHDETVLTPPHKYQTKLSHISAPESKPSTSTTSFVRLTALPPGVDIHHIGTRFHEDTLFITVPKGSVKSVHA